MIDGPAPDVVDRLKKSGARISTNITPHVFQYHPSLVEGSPWTDIRVRKAANLAIDRDAIVKLLNGLVTPAYGEVDRSSAWFGKPTFEIKYAPDEARKLMTEAGYGKTKPMKARISIQASGTNQTVNEAIQEMLKEAFFNIEFKPVELEALMTGWRGGAKADMNKDVSATNVTHVTSDPFYAVNRFFASDQTAPTGVNWSFYKNPEVDRLVVELKSTFDPAKQDEIAAQDPRQGGRRCGDDLGLSRHHAAGAVGQDQEVRPGPELVPGPGAGRDVDVILSVARTSCRRHSGDEVLRYAQDDSENRPQLRARRQGLKGAGPRRRQGGGLLGRANGGLDGETAGERCGQHAAEGVAAAGRIDGARRSLPRKARRSARSISRQPSAPSVTRAALASWIDVAQRLRFDAVGNDEAAPTHQLLGPRPERARG